MHASSCCCSTCASGLRSLVRSRGAVFGEKIIGRDGLREACVPHEVGQVQCSPIKNRNEETRVIGGDGEVGRLRKEQFRVAVRSTPLGRVGLDVWGQWRGSAEKWVEREGRDGDVGGREGEIGLKPVENVGLSGIGIDLW